MRYSPFSVKRIRPEVVGCIHLFSTRAVGRKIFIDSEVCIKKRTSLLPIRVIIVTASLLHSISSVQSAQVDNNPESGSSHSASIRIRSSRVALQDVTVATAGKHLDPNESSGWLDEPPVANGNRPRHAEKDIDLLDELLDSLPVLSVGQKHAATFECELNKEDSAKQLVWLKLNRDHQQKKGNNTATDEISLLSLNQKLITPDKRFKVRRQSAQKWSLTLDQVAPDDGHAYYLCQAGATGASSRQSSAPSAYCDQSNNDDNPSCQRRQQPQLNSSVQKPASRFVGGAKLNVLAPPKIIELDTSPSLVQAEEFEQVVLRCKVIGEPQSQLMWKREDGQGLTNIEQRFKHEIERRPSQILSVDSSELLFEPHFNRNQAGAYHCIASNGVQPGVSRRINVVAVKCRASADPASLSEPCDRAVEHPGPVSPEHQPVPNDRPRVWRTGQRSNVAAGQAQYSLDHQQAKLSTSSTRYRQPMIGNNGGHDKRRTQSAIQRNNTSEISISNGNCGRLISSVSSKLALTMFIGLSLVQQIVAASWITSAG